MKPLLVAMSLFLISVSASAQSPEAEQEREKQPSRLEKKLEKDEDEPTLRALEPPYSGGAPQGSGSLSPSSGSQGGVGITFPLGGKSEKERKDEEDAELRTPPKHPLFRGHPDRRP